MTFSEFILNKKPLWVDRNLKVSVAEMIQLVDEWQQHQYNRTLEKKTRDAGISFPSIEYLDEEIERLKKKGYYQ